MGSKLVKNSVTYFMDGPVIKSNRMIISQQSYKYLNVDTIINHNLQISTVPANSREPAYSQAHFYKKFEIFQTPSCTIRNCTQNQLNRVFPLSCARLCIMADCELYMQALALSPCAVNSSSYSDCLDHPSPMFSFCRHISQFRQLHSSYFMYLVHPFSPWSSSSPPSIFATMYSRTISPGDCRIFLVSQSKAHECLGNNRQLNTTDHSAHTTIRTQVNTHTHMTPSNG